MASVIPYLTRKWNLVGRTHGADLGNDCFQFRFQDEKDLRTVLANRPYQYGRWMIILQRWEPIISPTFPSQIPFWINLKGIPLHFWDEKTIRDIGQEFGTLEDYVLTKTTARVRVMMDGLKPIPQDSVLEFSSGEECVVALEYEKLENFCTFCLKLSHLERECPDKPPSERLDREKRANSNCSVEEIQRPQPPARHQQVNLRHDERIHPPRRHNKEAPAFHQRVDRHGNPFGERATTYHSRAPPLRNKITPPTDREAPTNQERETEPINRGENREISPQLSTRRTEQARRHLNQRSETTPEQVWQVKSQHTPRRESGEHGREQGRDPLERNLDREEFTALLPTGLPPPRSTEEIMEELREVTYQYTNVADPIESAARRQRVLNGELHGLMVITAASIMESEQINQQVQLAQQAYLAMHEAEAPAEDLEMEQPNVNTTEIMPPQQSKKRGRPPNPKTKTKTRDLRISPKVFKGSSSRKRNLSFSTASPANSSSRASRRITTAGGSNTDSNRADNTRVDTNTTSSRPKTQVFPESSRQPRDFPRLSPPLP